MAYRIFSDCWGPGQLFAFSAFDGRTDFSDGLVLRSLGEASALEIKLPEECGVIWMDDAPPRHAEIGGDFFVLETSHGTVRGAMPDAYHWLIEGLCRVAGVSGRYLSRREGNLTLFGVRSHFQPSYLRNRIEELLAARRAWLERLPIPEHLSELRLRTLCKAFSQLKTQYNSPEGLLKHGWTTPDRWPHRAMWLWDSVFHALALRHIDCVAAKESLLAVFDVQLEDGMIPHMASPGEKSHIIQPPVLAYGVEKILEKDCDQEFLQKIYPKNAAFLHWIMANRNCDGNGLVEWLIEGNVNCHCGESGMDNSPRFDHSLHLEATDFNAFLSQDCAIMAKFAATLGLGDDAAMWRRENERLNRLINERLWNEKNGFYLDYDVETGQQVPVRTSAGFLPLLCGAANASKAERLAESLRNPHAFGTAFPVPSIAADCPNAYRKDMWRGPVWINLNCLIAEGFARCGQPEAAALLRRKTVAEIERQFAKYGTFFEFYDDRNECDPPQLLRKGSCNPADSVFHQVFMDYGWTAAWYIDLIFEKFGL